MQTFWSILRTSLKLLLRRGIRDSYSQDGEDLLVDDLLRSGSGVYVDVGAFHPIQYSNTYRFYKRGWKGVVIDPNEAWKPLYQFFRPRDTFVNAGVASEAGERKYYMFSDGAYNTFSKEAVDTLRTKSYPTFRQAMLLPVRPLGALLAELDIEEIDFLSIDVEGLDMEVLGSHDWTKPPKIIAIEDNAFDFANPGASASFRYLTEKGYTLAAGSPRTLIYRQNRVS